MSEPLVTVVVTSREGHASSGQSLRSLLADDVIPFKLIYVDIASPSRLAGEIRELAAERDFQILRHDDWIAPALARKRALAEVTTRYAACADNDVFVERGCLAKLVRCAEETGAGLVCPLYIQAGGQRAPTIHMAGGVLEWSEDETPRLLRQHHRLAGLPLGAAAALAREKVDFPEFHYVVGRMDLLNQPGAISDDIVLLHEHIDLALFARRQGLAVYFEPEARATYLAFDSRRLMDLEFYRKRWDVEACRRSLDAFSQKWLAPDNHDVVDAEESYAAGRLRAVELSRTGRAGADLAKPMQRGELAQTRTALREQAFERGYTEQVVRAIDRSCDTATVMFDGLYRPDGRPFLNHAIGTASALVRYELASHIVRAGLLHAAFTQRPEWMSDAVFSDTLKAERSVESLIRGQKQVRARFERADTDLSLLNMAGAAVACILAANETDICLSGEYRASGRRPVLTPAALGRITQVLALFGISGLALSARHREADADAWPLFGAKAPPRSIRLDEAKKRLATTPSAKEDRV